MEWVFFTSRAAWTCPFRTTSTPRSRVRPEPASRIASSRLRGPSESSYRGGRCAAAKTTGRPAGSTRSSRKAVSSRESVPCVTTMPASRGRSANTAATRSASSNWSSGCIRELPMRTKSSVVTAATESRPGRAARRSPAFSGPPAPPEIVPPVPMRWTSGSGCPAAWAAKARMRRAAPARTSRTMGRVYIG